MSSAAEKAKEHKAQDATKGPEGNPAQAQADKKAAHTQAAKELEAVAKGQDKAQEAKPNTAQESTDGAVAMMKELGGELTSGALKEFRSWVDAVLKSREAGELADARKRILEIAQSVGVPLADLIGAKGGKGSQIALKLPSAAVPVKYRHPEQPELTWTGRGRQPKWVVEWLAAHEGKDDAIKVAA